MRTARQPGRFRPDGSLIWEAQLTMMFSTMMRPALAASAAVTLLATGCAGRLAFTDATPYEVQRQSLSRDYANTPLKKHDLVALRIRALCPSREYSDVNDITYAIAGAQVTQLLRYDAAGKSAPRESARVAFGAGTYKQGCIHFDAPLNLGEYKVGETQFHVKLLVRNREDKMITPNKGELLSEVGQAVRLAEGNNDELAEAIQAPAYHELFKGFEGDPETDDVRFEVDLTFGGSARNAVPTRNGQYAVFGRIDGYPEKMPSESDIKAMTVTPEGKVLWQGNEPYVRTPYITVETLRLSRNPFMRPMLELATRNVSTNSMDTQHNNDGAIAVLNQYNTLVTDAQARGDWPAEEHDFLNKTAQCTAAWAHFRQQAGGVKVLAGNISREVALSLTANLDRVRKECNALHTAEDVTFSRDAEIQPIESRLVFSPYGSEIRLRTQSIELLRHIVARIDLALGAASQANLSASLSQKEQQMQALMARIADLEKMNERLDALREKLAGLSKYGIEVINMGDRLVLRLPGDVLFKSGKTNLEKPARDVLMQVADAIRGNAELASKRYQVAGHTDNVGKYEKNLNLSLMRAQEVTLFLTSAKGGGLPRENFSAAGFADLEPVMSNDTKEGQQKNRRVELTLMPDLSQIKSLSKEAESVKK